MKTSFFAFVAGLGSLASSVLAQTLTVQQQITAFSPENFTTTLGGPQATDYVAGVQFRAVTVGQLPALAGYGVAMVLVNLDACSILPPHIHPRATEMQYVIEGELRVAFVEENGGEGAVVNDLVQGDVSFFPQGLIHYQQNLGCEPATFLAALNSEDPGTVLIATSFFQLPSEAIEATLNFESPEVQALVEGLPMAPAAAREQCLLACDMVDDDLSQHHD